MTERLSLNQEKFLELVEKTEGEKIRQGFEIHLRRYGENIINAYPVTLAEHNWFPFDTPAKEIAHQILCGYRLEIRDKDGATRSIDFNSYVNEIIEKWKKYFKKKTSG